MIVLHSILIFLWMALIPVRAAEPVDKIFIGSNPSLSAGAQALQIGDYEQGLKLTLEGLHSATMPRERASAYSNLCAGYLGIRQFDKALEACDKALDFNDRNWRIYNNRALALLYAGRIVAAGEDLEKGLAINPDSATLAKVSVLIDEQKRIRVVATESAIEPH